MTETDSTAVATQALRDLLLDTFARVSELVQRVTDGLSRADATYRPDAEANSINWLVWHLARIQDDHLADVAGVEQVWIAGDWNGKLGLPFRVTATGFGHGPDDVAAVDVDPGELAAYHAEVDAFTTRYLADLDPAELARIVDERWDPPVTLAVRIVSVASDCLQHAGQAAYVRGLATRR